MQITFHGAAGTVTGSKHLLTLENGTRILLDCGLFQGKGLDTHQLNRNFGFDPAAVDYLMLSHAHIDHSGLIPRLVRKGFKGRIFCTEPTFDLCKLLLADSAHIQESDTRFVNKSKRRKKQQEVAPLYTIDDALNCLRYFEPVPYDEEIPICEGVKLRFTDNGHILGSAAINLSIRENGDFTQLCFTGDIGRYKTLLLKDPKSFPQADVLICESTYGDRLHERIETAAQRLLDAITETCLKRKGRLIIPAFSLGRTQELIYSLNKLDLHGLLPSVKIYADSPLAINATEITRRNLHHLNEQVQQFADNRTDPFGFDQLHYLRSKEKSMLLNTLDEPCVIISASGMAEGGRVKHHIRHGISNPANTIMLVGYAEPQSLAGRLQRGDTEVSIFGEIHAVKATVEVAAAFSAHADYQEILHYLKCQDAAKTRQVFLVHGEQEAQVHLKQVLQQVGYKQVIIPEQHESFSCN